MGVMCHVITISFTIKKSSKVARKRPPAYDSTNPPPSSVTSSREASRPSEPDSTWRAMGQMPQVIGKLPRSPYPPPLAEISFVKSTGRKFLISTPPLFVQSSLTGSNHTWVNQTKPAPAAVPAAAAALAAWRQAWKWVMTSGGYRTPHGQSFFIM